MSEPCCSLSTERPPLRRCPASGSRGQAVAWTTVAALSTGPVPPRQEFRLCRDRGCDVVYFGTAGTVVSKSQLTVRAGFKDGGDGLVCYCFLHREGDIARQLEETGTTDVFDSIKREVAADNCACEVRNPSGGCCLGDVRTTIRSLRQRMEVMA